MAYSQADIEALRAAIATGAKRVKFGSGPDSREVEYRTLDEMRQTLAIMEASPRTGPTIVTYAAHSRD